MKEVLDIKYKELEESKSILEVLENYVMYKKKLDEILIGKERLNKKEFSEQDKVGIIEDGVPKKMCDPGNYVLPVKINGVVEMSALVDIGASVSVLPYSLYKDLGHGNPRPYQTNLTMADNTQAKAMGEVKNVRIQIGYQAYVVDLLILDILVDPELPLLLGRPFLRTCGAIIDMGRAFEMKGDDDKQFDHKDYWTRVGKPTLTNHKEVLMKEPLMRIMHKFIVGSLAHRKSRKDKLPNPLIAEYERRNKRNTITYSLQPMSNANLKSFGVPKVANWHLFDGYGFEDTLREMMKLEYIYEGDGDIFVLEFFSTLYLDKDVDRNNLMKEKCIWFRLCGHEHILTLPEFAIVLGLLTEDEVKHHLFGVYFGRLELDDKQFDHKDYWTRVDELDVENTCLKKETEMPTQAEEGSSEPRQEHRGLNTSLSEIEQGNVWRDSMLIQNNYMLEHSMPILHYLANQGNFAYPTYEPPNVPPYPYPYIPYPYPYTHYPNLGNQSNQGGSYGLGGDDYFTSVMPDFGGSSLGYAVGGSSRGDGFNDDDMDE
ncbi:retrovirus-related pol polyprotein from transposon TNT 1-94 [Tanacetum coccineum]